MSSYVSIPVATDGPLSTEATRRQLNRRQAETVEKLAADFLVRLRELIAHCQSPEAGGHTPSDFPMAKVKQSQLDKLSARFGKKAQ